MKAKTAFKNKLNYDYTQRLAKCFDIFTFYKHKNERNSKIWFIF